MKLKGMIFFQKYLSELDLALNKCNQGRKILGIVKQADDLVETWEYSKAKQAEIIYY